MPRKQKMKAGWMFGAIALALGLLIIGSMVSNQIDESPTTTRQDIIIDPSDLENIDTSPTVEVDQSNITPDQ